MDNYQPIKIINVTKFLVLVAVLTFFIGCSMTGHLEKRVLILEKDYKLRKKTGDLPKDRLAIISARLDQTIEKLQIMRGLIEEVKYDLERDINTLKESLDERQERIKKAETVLKTNGKSIVKIERYLNLDTSKNYELKKSTAKRTKNVSKVREIYDKALKAFDNGEIETARKGFQNVIDNFPKSSHADNAQFWIGEIFFRAKWYEKAILEYQKVIENYPKGNKVQAAFLKQGLAFFNIEDKDNARLILTELVKKYPKSKEANIAKRKLREIR